MRTLAQAVFNDRNLALLPDYVEGCVLPALIVGPGKTSRANIAAGLRLKTGRPLFVICADETAADNFRRDLERYLEEPCETLISRDMNFYGAEGVSRGSEQKRIRTLYALLKNNAPVIVCTVTGLLQRTLPPEELLESAFTIEDGKSVPPQEIEKSLIRCGYNRSAQVEGAGSFLGEEVYWTFFLPPMKTPSDANSGAMKWTPWAFSIRTVSEERSGLKAAKFSHQEKYCQHLVIAGYY